MFARTANVQTVAHQHAARAQVGQTFSKVQEPDRLNAPLRSRRPVLSRRWKLDPVSGKPVCAWEVERPDQPRDMGIDPIWPMQVADNREAANQHPLTRQGRLTASHRRPLVPLLELGPEGRLTGNNPPATSPKATRTIPASIRRSNEGRHQCRTVNWCWRGWVVIEDFRQ